LFRPTPISDNPALGVSGSSAACVFASGGHGALLASPLL